MDYLFGVVQGLVVIAVLWVKISGLDKRVDRLERRFNDYMNHKAQK